MPNRAKADVIADSLAMIAVAALAFGLTYHPYFFGDELVLHRLAIKDEYAFWPVFRDINAYKPRLIDNGIISLLATWQLGRWATAVLQVLCLVWICALLYAVVRYLLEGDRLLAWLLIAFVVTSRYGMTFYYDYSSGLLDLLGTALLLSALLAAALAWRERFDRRLAAVALGAAIFCVFVHERFAAGLAAGGFALAIAEWFGPSARRRLPIIAWALSLGVLPVLLFSAANHTFGSLPIATGTSGQLIGLGWDTIRTLVTYTYNVFLGGNYGPAWYWGTYNGVHAVGKNIAMGTAICTVVLATVIVLRNGIAWRNRWQAICLLAIAMALIAVASLPGSYYLQARWMYPVGILVALICIVFVQGRWRHVAVGFMLAVNLLYLALGTQDGLAQVSASRSADALATMVLGAVPKGGSGIVVGFASNAWTIGGGDAVDMGPRPGDTFSKVSLKSAVHVDPFTSGREFDPALYDFGLAFDGFDARQVARYKLVDVGTAIVIAGASMPGMLPPAADLDRIQQGSTAIVVEYYNQSLDHYFITHLPKEIAALDAGVTIKHWVRTGQMFLVYTVASAGTSPVCRFYVPPGKGDSHFFGRGTKECTATATGNPSFVNEDAQVFHVVLPAAGVCPPRMREVYRVFSNRDDINHRYTIERSIRDRMVASGWVAEGDGPNTVVMCVPAGGS